jgi:hypothetical protein
MTWITPDVIAAFWAVLLVWSVYVLCWAVTR